MNLPIGNRRLYAPHHEPVTDPRKALGAFPRDPSYPDAACAYCLGRGGRGALIQATHYDPTGKPCCPLCAGNANRRCQ